MSLKHKTQATGTNDDESQVSVDAWNEGHAIDEAQPSAPSSGLDVFAQVRAGRRNLGIVDPYGNPYALGLHPLFGGRYAVYWPVGYNANATALAMPTVTTSGTTALRQPTPGSIASRMHRIGLSSSATAGSLVTWYSAVSANNLLSDGGATSYLFFGARFCVSDAAAVSGARMFVGLSTSTSAPTNVEPSTLVSSVGLAQLSSSNNLHIVWGGSSAQTAIDLGSNFPANTLTADAYEFSLYSPPGVTKTIYYEVRRLGTSYVATGTIAGTTEGVELPGTSALLHWRAWRSNNATALSVGLDIGLVYIETDC